ncbi:TetR/AcrR family transcriptional regulator, partial [Salmonella enterica subsp. enterica serovar Weltevreden]
RAGVSRGAAQHHFPTREDLITAALEYMFDTRNEQARREAEAMSEQLDGIARTEAVVEGLVESYTSPLFKAALQVWTHAAADPVLRERIVPLEAKFG